MKVAFFSTHRFDRPFFELANGAGEHEIMYLEPRLDRGTSVLARGADAVCAFVNDQLDAAVLEQLDANGIRMVALRCAGFNNVDLERAKALGLTVTRVPAYSPHAVAEHTIALMLTLNRKIHRAYARVRDGNFMLDGLLGFDLCERTVGVVGTGRIGSVVARILRGFGCRVIAYDITPSEHCRQLGVEYVSLEDIWRQSDIITFHVPLDSTSFHMLNTGSLAQTKPGVMIINTGRGGLVDTRAVVGGLKSGHIGYLGLDVYEEEEKLFFQDLSSQAIQDDLFVRLMTFPNVVITAHQGFFTEEALRAIAETTIGSLSAFERGATTGRELC